MNARAVGALLCSITGVAVPVALLLMRYGIDERVSAGTLTQTELLQLLGAMGVAVAGGLCAALLLRSSTPTLGQVIRDALHETAKEERRRQDRFRYPPDGQPERRASA